MSNISFIGCGNMGYALMTAVLSAIKAAGEIKSDNIFVTDADTEKARDAAASLGVKIINSNAEAAHKSNLIFLAVKPQALPAVLAEISPAVKKRIDANDAPVLISMAAGWSTNKIQSAISDTLQKSGETLSPEKIPVVRIMPNTPALIGKGMIALSASNAVTYERIGELEEYLSSAGIVDIIDEHYMDAVTGLSGSGPAFVYLFIEALADGAVHAGLPRDKALMYAAQTVAGSAAMVQETKKHPGELKDMVTSPGGTTIAGIAALENGAFRSTVMKAVEAAFKRSKELG
ncbi:MAG: pyrroline-5-carboxylate reductase [Treponema sp.]|nr:pyrroline-5-carboxylate reductase [Treponema sp.]